MEVKRSNFEESNMKEGNASDVYKGSRRPASSRLLQLSVIILHRQHLSIILSDSG